MINEQNNRILFRLTVVTVLALRFNLVAGLFGMNVGGIPFSQHRHGFLVIVGAVAVCTGLVALLVARRRRVDSTNVRAILAP